MIPTQLTLNHSHSLPRIPLPAADHIIYVFGQPEKFHVSSWLSWQL